MSDLQNLRRDIDAQLTSSVVMHVDLARALIECAEALEFCRCNRPLDCGTNGIKCPRCKALAALKEAP